MFRIHVKNILTNAIVKTEETETLREARLIESNISMDLDYEKYYTEIEAVVTKK